VIVQPSQSATFIVIVVSAGAAVAEDISEPTRTARERQLRRWR
jgi:hypothetical protein